MTGYTRADVTNNIADGNVINASDLDNEFDAIDAAFNFSTGHTHDGTSNGAPITKVGPTQDVVVSASAVTPKTTNTVDLGSSLLQYKDLYIDGTANIDSLVADTADINGGTVDNAVIGGSTAAAGTFTTLTANTSLTASTADINGGTIDGTTIGGTTPAAGSFTTLTTSGTVTHSGGTANGVPYLNGSKVLTSGSALTFDGTNLGIGTSSPTNKLTVSGNANITGNTTLGDASTDTVTVNGYMGVGGSPDAGRGLVVTPSSLTGTTQIAISASLTGTSAATSLIVGVNAAATTAPASYTASDVIALRVANPGKGAGSTITNLHGVYISDQTQGTNNYGITSLVSSGTNKWNIYASGTAANYFAGNVLIGTTTSRTFGNTGYLSVAQIEGVNGSTSSLGITRNSANVSGSAITLAKSRGTTVGANTVVVSGDELALVDFQGADGSGLISAARIQAFVDGTPGTNDMPGRLVFSTTADGASSPTERLRLTTSSAVFNDPGNDYDFRVESDTNSHALFVDAGNSRVGVNTSTMVCPFTVSGPWQSALYKNTVQLISTNSFGADVGAGVGFLATYDSVPNTAHMAVVYGAKENATSGNYAGYFAVQTRTHGGSLEEIARATSKTSGGYLRMASGTGGIQFNGDTAAANALDDYEEGTWTPTFTGDGGDPTITFSDSFARYTKIGRTVYVEGRLTISSISGGSGFLRIANFPFSSATSSRSLFSISRISGLSADYSGQDIAALMLDSTTSAFIYVTANTTGSHSVLTTSALTNSTSITFSGSYTAA